MLKARQEKAPAVVHLFINWIQEQDLWEEDFDMVVATVAGQAATLEILKASGWKLFHGISDLGPNNRTAFYVATHANVKTVEDAEARLHRLRLSGEVEIRNEPLDQMICGVKDLTEVKQIRIVRRHRSDNLATA